MLKQFRVSCYMNSNQHQINRRNWITNFMYIITTRSRRMGKVMFLQVCVCSRGLPQYLVLDLFLGLWSQVFSAGGGGEVEVGGSTRYPGFWSEVPLWSLIPGPFRGGEVPHDPIIGPVQSPVQAGGRKYPSPVTGPTQGSAPGQLPPPPLPGQRYSPMPQESKFFLRGGRYASCGHARGFSCFFVDKRNRICKLHMDDFRRRWIRTEVWK